MVRFYNNPARKNHERVNSWKSAGVNVEKEKMGDWCVNNLSSDLSRPGGTCEDKQWLWHGVWSKTCMCLLTKKIIWGSFVLIQQKASPLDLDAVLCVKAHIALPKISFRLLVTTVSQCVFVISVTLSGIAYIVGWGTISSTKSPGLHRANSLCSVADGIIHQESIVNVRFVSLPSIISVHASMCVLYTTLPDPAGPMTQPRLKRLLLLPLSSVRAAGGRKAWETPQTWASPTSHFNLRLPPSWIQGVFFPLTHTDPVKWITRRSRSEAVSHYLLLFLWQGAPVAHGRLGVNLTFLSHTQPSTNSSQPI